MPLTVGANTYITDDELIAYGNDRGIELPADREQLIVNAADWVDSHWQKFQGYKTDPAQAMQWPRKNVYLWGSAVADDEYPIELKNAQAQAAIDAIDQGLQPVDTGRAIASEQADVVSVSYFNTGSKNQPILTKAIAFLEPLFKQGYQSTGGGSSRLQRW